MGNIALCCEKKRQLDVFTREIISVKNSTKGNKKKKSKSKISVSPSTSASVGPVLVISDANENEQQKVQPNSTMNVSKSKEHVISSSKSAPRSWNDAEILNWAAMDDDEPDTIREDHVPDADEHGWLKCEDISKTGKKAKKSPPVVADSEMTMTISKKPQAYHKAENKRPKSINHKDKSDKKPVTVTSPAPMGIFGRSEGSPDWSMPTDEASKPFRPVDDKSKRRKPKPRHDDESVAAPRPKPASQAPASVTPKPKQSPRATKPSSAAMTQVSSEPAAPLRWADEVDAVAPRSESPKPAPTRGAPRSQQRVEPQRQPSPIAPHRRSKAAVPAAPKPSQWTRPPASVVAARAQVPSAPVEYGRGKKGKRPAARTVTAHSGPVVHAQVVTKPVKLSCDATPFTPSGFASPFLPQMRVITASSVSDEDTISELSATVTALKVPGFSPNSSTTSLASTSSKRVVSPSVDALSPRSPDMKPILSAVLSPKEMHALDDAIRREEELERREQELREKLEQLRRKRGSADETTLSSASTVLEAETPERMSSLSLGDGLPSSFTI